MRTEDSRPEASDMGESGCNGDLRPVCRPMQWQKNGTDAIAESYQDSADGAGGVGDKVQR